LRGWRLDGHRDRNIARLNGLHGSDELVASPADGPDVALSLAVIAERAAGRLDAAGQCRLTHETTTPHRVEEFLLGHESVVVSDQLGQHVEHLRFDADHPIAAAQFVALGVEDEVVEPPHSLGARLRRGGRRLGCGQRHSGPISGFSRFPRRISRNSQISIAKPSVVPPGYNRSCAAGSSVAR